MYSSKVVAQGRSKNEYVPTLIPTRVPEACAGGMGPPRHSDKVCRASAGGVWSGDTAENGRGRPCASAN